MRLDKEQISKKLGIDEPMYSSLIQEFYEQLKQKMEELDKAIACGKQDEIFTVSHYIKGAAGNLRLMEIHDIAKEIEDNAKTADNSPEKHKLQIKRSHDLRDTVKSLADIVK